MQIALVINAHHYDARNLLTACVVEMDAFDDLTAFA
ncbi:Uncharacterised protein [Vibrio cholerae]|uniref:Uncharacterized protein n=1 Tax=Vibrio cholerae TaxID=666 RepID=A0A655VVN8_VIBCL|nr:Uncharacterised protein [Vibrio cholerae]CSB07591.1 Uncharacterised protein [Vibrio cholerae]CSB77293.1 Uncharacterised protein [Vibrio cholerae]CSC00583.1 Uncharacterised protein [Vibrio cholerae]CSC77735.1 Uncharacterised protein [Vibrio cholerae]